MQGNVGGRMGGSSPAPPSDDGWTSVSAKPRGTDKIDTAKLLKLPFLSKQTVGDDILFGPPSMRNATWGSGSRGGSSSSGTRSQESNNNVPSNRYAALDTREGSSSSSSGFSRQSATAARGKNVPPRFQEEQRSSSVGFGRNSPRLLTPTRDSREGSRESSVSRDTPQGASDLPGLHASTQPDASRYASLPGSLSGSRDPSRESSLSRGNTPPVAAESRGGTPACERLSIGDEKKLSYIIQEYLSVQDIKEATLSISELGLSASLLPCAVSSVFNLVLEKSTQEMSLTGDLLTALLFSQHITVDHFIKGLQDVLSLVPDLQMDIPKVWDYLALVLSSQLLSNVISLRHLIDCCAPADISTLLAHVLKACVIKQDEATVQRLWIDSRVQWIDILPAGASVGKFLSDSDLMFLSDDSLSSAAISSPNDSSSSSQQH